MVDWFIAQSNGVWSREQAVRFGQLLRRIGCISHVVEEHDFADEFLFFKVNVRNFSCGILAQKAHLTVPERCLCHADSQKEKFSHHRSPKGGYPCSIYSMSLFLFKISHLGPIYTGLTFLPRSLKRSSSACKIRSAVSSSRTAISTWKNTKKYLLHQRQLIGWRKIYIYATEPVRSETRLFGAGCHSCFLSTHILGNKPLSRQ